MLTIDDRFTASSLLGFVKNGVRSGSIAITETSTPYVREVLRRQLNQGIQLHAAIFQYMLVRGLYPSYQLDRLIQNDIQNAQIALRYPIQ